MKNMGIKKKLWLEVTERDPNLLFYSKGVKKHSIFFSSVGSENYKNDSLVRLFLAASA